MTEPDARKEPGTGSKSTTRWWLNPALAKLAFSASTRDAPSPGASPPPPSVLRSLLDSETAGLDLDLSDPKQREFGEYELIEQVGRGGMGVVYRARQRNLGREVAIKLLSAGQGASEDLVESLRSEAQNAALLQHPNIVVVHEMGEHGGLIFFAMQLVRGRSLSQWLEADGRLPPREAATLLRSVAEAVDYAHRLGVLHLDLKPGNILVNEQGEPLVADFGLARRLEQAIDLANDRVSGTPSYMAPEQAQIYGPTLSPATDVWALGAVLYEMLTGQPPFNAGEPSATVRLLLQGKVRRPSRITAVPADLEAICLHCLERDPAARYATARALADDLGRYLDGRAVSVRPLNAMQRLGRWAQREPKLAVTSLLAVLALVAGLIATTQQWQRAEANAAVSISRLWESRREAALQLEQEGRGWEALPRLLANILEEERGGQVALATLDRRRIGMLLNQGAVLIDRATVTDAKPLAVAVSDDASLLAMGFNDQSVRWYDTTTLRERGRVSLANRPTSDGQPRVPLLLRFVDTHRLRVTQDWIANRAAPSEDDSWIIDLDHARVIEAPAEFLDFASASYSADGQYALLRDTHGRAQCWRLDPWRACSTLVAAAPDTAQWMIGREGRYALLLGQASRELHFYALQDLARPVWNITPPGNTGIAAWQESRDGRWLALGDFEGRLYLLDLSSRTLRQLPTPRSREVAWVDFSEDDAWLAAVTWDGYAYAFDVATANALAAGQMQQDFVPQRVAVSHRQRLLLVSGGGQVYGPGGKDIALWRLPEAGARASPATRIGVAPAGRGDAGRYPVGWSSATGLLATAGVDGHVQLWRLPRSPRLPARAANQIAEQLQFDGKRVVDVAWNRLRLVTPSGIGLTPWMSLPQPPGFAELVDDGHTLVVTTGAQLRVYDAPAMRARFAPLPLPDSPQRLLASADGARVVTTYGVPGADGYQERLLVHDIRAGKRLSGNALLPGALHQLAFSPDHARLLVIGPASGASWVFATDTLRPVGEYPNDDFQPVSAGTFDRSQRDVLLATLANGSGLGENSLLRWDPATDVVRDKRALGPVQPVSVLATPQGPFVAGADAELIDPGGAHARRPRRLAIEDTEGGIALSPDGRLVARTFHRHAQVLDLTTGANVGPPLAADIPAMDSLWWLAFSPDGNTLLARSLYGYWVRWTIAPDERRVPEIAWQVEQLGIPVGGVPHAAANPPIERAQLRAQDPGPWPQPTAPPAPPIARWVDGLPIPARAPGTSPYLLDMTAAYNFAPDTVLNTYFSVLPSLRPRPVGVQRIAGVEYDLRGMAQIGTPDPRAGTGIPVPPVPVAAVHLLMTVSTPTPIADERTVAQVRLHYRDGSQALLPIRTQRDVPGYTAHDRPVPLAWAQLGGLPMLGSRDLILSAPRLPNPHPERLIRSLDLEVADRSRLNRYVCLGITVEPVTSPSDFRTSGQGVAMSAWLPIAPPNSRRSP